MKIILAPKTTAMTRESSRTKDDTNDDMNQVDASWPPRDRRRTYMTSLIDSNPPNRFGKKRAALRELEDDD